MCKKKRNRLLVGSLVTLAVVAVVLVGAAWSPVAAQGVPAIPPPKPGNEPTDISTMLNNLSVAAKFYYAQYVRTIEGQLLYYLKMLAGALAIPIACQAFLKLLRQHEGGSKDMFWWFGRVAVSFALISGSTYLVAQTALYGRILSFGGMDQRSYLNTLVVEQQRLLNENMERFQVNSTCMTVDGKVIWLNPDPGNPNSMLSVLEPKEASLKNLAEGKIDTSNWSLPLGLKLVQVTRGLMELVDFSLLYISMFLYLGFRLISPVAACVYIDRQFAERFTKPIAWGGFVFLVVQPFIAQIFRLLAYSLGNTALYAVIPPKPLYSFNPRSMLAVGNHSDPTMSMYFLAVSMVFCTGLLLLSYWVAFRFSKGEVLESITSTVQGWMMSGAAAGVATYSGAAAAGLQHQAQLAQLQGNAEASTVEAKAQRAAEQETTRASWMHQNASTHAQAATARAQTNANLAGELIQAQTTHAVARQTNAAILQKEDRTAKIAQLHGDGTQGVQAQKEVKHAEGAQDVSNLNNEMNLGVTAIALVAGGAAGGGAGAAGGGGAAGAGASGYMRQQAASSGGNAATGFITSQYQKDVTSTVAQEAAAKQGNINAIVAHHTTQTAKTYQEKMDIAADTALKGQTSAAQARAGGSLAGINQSESMMIEANQANYDSQMRAQGMRHDARDQAIQIQRQAGEDGAEMQREAARMTLIGQQLAKQIEQMNFKW